VLFTFRIDIFVAHFAHTCYLLLEVNFIFSRINSGHLIKPNLLLFNLPLKCHNRNHNHHLKTQSSIHTGK
jgi:hypothetical protein